MIGYQLELGSIHVEWEEREKHRVIQLYLL